MYVPCCPSCSDWIHYAIRHPVVAIVVIALLLFPSVNISYFICNDVPLGTDERAEQYYSAILKVHQEVGFNQDEYAPSGLTAVQAKEIPCIDSDEQVEYWLSSEHNEGIGRLYYYMLLATYHRWFHPEDAQYKEQDIIDNPEIVKTIQLNESAYELATVAYFHNRTIVNSYLLKETDALPTEELDRVKALLLEEEFCNQTES